MLHRSESRRNFLGTTALGAMAGAAALAAPTTLLAQAVGIKPADLPDLTIKEVKVYNLSRGARGGAAPTTQDTRGGRGRGAAAPAAGQGLTQIASIVTNSGIEGNYTLAASYWHPDWSTAGWLDFAKPLCTGKSVLDMMTFTSQWVPEKRRRGQSAYASAIDNCLWDILGKAVNLPVYRLLGAHRDKVLAYASSQHHATIEEFVEEIATIKSQGFTAYKIHPPSPGGGHDYKLDIEVIKAVRKAAGDDFTLLHDPVAVYTRDEAMKVGRVLQDMKFVAYEDPIPTDDIEGLVELCRDLEIPIHIGEFIFSMYDYAEYICRGYASCRKRRGATPSVTVAAMPPGSRAMKRRIVGFPQRRLNLPVKTIRVPPSTKFMAAKCRLKVSTCRTVITHSGAGRKLESGSVIFPLLP